MTEVEKLWIDKCCKQKETYRIDVDNDSVFVVDLRTDACVFEFDHYGWEMFIDLLDYIGCNVDAV